MENYRQSYDEKYTAWFEAQNLRLADCCRAHWSSERFSSAWISTISVLLAKGRARVSVADAATDWPKRIRDTQYSGHESTVAGAFNAVAAGK